MGFSTALTTNGTLLTPKRVAGLREHLQLVAVSVDGPPVEHAAMRGSDTAFGSLCHGLELLKDSGLPYSIAFTLTRYNAGRLSWLYDFADRMGAIGIHIHPLCNFGAARTHLSSAVPDSTEFLVAAWLLALLAEQRGPGGPVVTLDAIRRSTVENSCWPLLNAIETERSCAAFSDLVPALVVESDGCIVPFIYGFPRTWSLGFLGVGSLGSGSEDWRKTAALPLHMLVKSTLEALAAAGEDYIDLFAALLEAAHLQASSAHP